MKNMKWNLGKISNMGKRRFGEIDGRNKERRCT